MRVHPAHSIVGPTASGKSEVAHAVAVSHGWRILSADSMNIYRGMDIGTAKPSREMMSEVNYLGLDLADPNETFNVAAFMDAAREALTDPEPVLVCGGTGLYLKALSEGLDSGPEPDGEKRWEYELKLETGGVEALRSELRTRSPQALSALDDPMNPRRLIRALERLDAGHPADGNWGQGGAGLITGLRLPREILKQRIEDRAARMFANGLLEEVQGLLDSGITFSATAAQAIGYREALAVLNGELQRAEAVEQTALRTRQLVKKQLTWFRNKMEIRWVDWDGQEPVKAVAKRFKDLWAQHECGTVRF